MKLSGNTILITGGASGIGLELAKELIKKGNVVIVTGRNKAKLEKAKKQLPGLNVIKSDVSVGKDIEALYKQVTKQFPALNILINNAGIMRTVNFHAPHDSLANLTEEIDINLTGSIRMAKQFLPHLKKQPAAAIVNVSSGLAFVPLPISPIYCATKAALHSFSLSLRLQLKNTNVRVFELAPPATQTEMMGDFDAEDMKGVSIMKVEDMTRDALNGMENDEFEIRPGQSNQLKFMSRLAPGFILNQMGKTVDRMLANS
ncbi:MAG: SDR family NAD(P)-dependent oxidoreductase [Spirochaetia bacterium]|nr:SDR family NAD(P)-dependent oxidoreductase [Spirochaetia bacterium]